MKSENVRVIFLSHFWGFSISYELDAIAIMWFFMIKEKFERVDAFWMNMSWNRSLARHVSNKNGLNNPTILAMDLRLSSIW